MSRARRRAWHTGAVSVIREFFRGAGLFLRGFGMWARNPGMMLLGAIPGLIVGLLFLGLLIGMVFWAPSIAGWVTPFADGWEPRWRDALRVLVTVAIFAGALAVGVLTFAGVTLAVASPFIERISQRTERELGGIPSPVDEPFWRSVRRGVRDAAVLIGTGIVTGALVFLIGLIPVVGGVLGWATGALVGGRALAIELTGTPGDARGIALRERQRLVASRRALSLGFGACVYLAFLVPGGAVLATPASAVGGTLLLRELVGEPTRPPAASSS